jgi:hypothetical protein
MAIVEGVECPRGHAIEYNGNYFCVTGCWVMGEERSKFNKHIIRTYLLQVYNDPRSTPSVKEMVLHYLKEYADE